MTIGRGLRLVMVAALFAGCESEVDDSPNNLPQASTAVDMAVVDAQAPVGDGGAADGGAPHCSAAGHPGCGDCPSVGDWYRFTELKVDKLDGRNHPLRPLLNALWAADITRAELNILIEVTAVEGDVLNIRVLNAARNEAHDGTYCLLPATEVPFVLRRDGCGLCQDTPAGINVYAGAVNSDEPSGYVPKNCAPELAVPHTIPIRNVLLSASTDGDCGHILEGKVFGAGLPKSALGKICTCATAPNAFSEQCVTTDDVADGCGGCPGSYRNLLTYLEMFGGGESLAYGCQTPEGEEAACLDASFAAERLTFTPVNCLGEQ